MLKWTEDQLVKLRELALAEMSNAEIAETIGVPVSEIYAKRSSLGLTIAKVQEIKNGEEATNKATLTIFKTNAKHLTHKQQLACAAYHLACFWYFARYKEVADWVLPCEMCEYISKCDLDSWENQRLLFNKAGVSISDKMIKQAISKKATINRSFGEVKEAQLEPSNKMCSTVAQRNAFLGDALDEFKGKSDDELFALLSE